MNEISSSDLLNRIFKEILPRAGYKIRESQIELADMIFETLQEARISLCEAEVGTGKTHAYIIAAIVNKLNNKLLDRIRFSYPNSNDFYLTTKMPVVISTSSVALQKAIAEEYLPVISRILLEHGIIEKPLTSAIRKGKDHYICDKRLEEYLASITDQKRSPYDELELRLLEGLKDNYFMDIDLDRFDKISNYIKSRISVPAQCNSRCSRYPECRYYKYQKYAKSYNHDFQICNHNFFIADARHRSKGATPLIPNYQAVIIDEAHKFLPAARQMYGNTIASDEIYKMTSYVRKVKFRNEQTAITIRSNADRLERLNRKLFEDLRGQALQVECEEDMERFKVKITQGIAWSLKSLIFCMDSLKELLDESSYLRDKPGNIHRYILRLLSELRDKFRAYCEPDKIVYWLEATDEDIKSQSLVRLCSIPKGLNRMLYEDFWCRTVPVVLTSGTLSVDGCFSHMKNSMGMDLIIADRVKETSRKSPFNFRKNVLLYISDHLPFPDSKNPEYINAIAYEVEHLIKATYGHSLVLFTSYKVMELVYSMVASRTDRYPMWKVEKRSLNSIDVFRQSTNGVLFASGNCWEGIDIPGDILSSLIIVKLPFAVPDPISEYEQTHYDSIEDYKDKVVFPEMIIKLKQGVGRLIRSESDTGVVSILDSRLREDGNYRNRVLKALPDCRVTDSISDVESFIKEKKEENYFDL